jgi:hypothetical protein
MIPVSILKEVRMRGELSDACALLTALALTMAAAHARSGGGQTAISFEAPRTAIRMAGDFAGSGWPGRLATPSEEGQFEVLVSKDAVPVLSPRCQSKYLVVRMPATMDEDAAGKAALERKRRLYADMLAAYNDGRPTHFDVFGGPYGKRLPDGKIEISGCNLFFSEPTTGNLKGRQ